MVANQLDLSGKSGKAFCPKKPNRTKFIKTPLHIDEGTDARLTRMAKKCHLSKQELARQMVKFCLDNEDVKATKANKSEQANKGE